MVRHLAVKTRGSHPADTLIQEYRQPGSANYKWVVANSLAFACARRHFAAITELAADSSQGISRQPLIARRTPAHHAVARSSRPARQPGSPPAPAEDRQAHLTNTPSPRASWTVTERLARTFI